MLANEHRRTTKTKYLKKMKTDYLVRFVVIVRKSRANVDGQQAIVDGQQVMPGPLQSPNPNRTGWRPVLFLSVSLISKISRFTS